MSTTNELDRRKAALSARQREALEQRIRGGKSHSKSAIPPASRSAPIPLSFAQERIWLHEQLKPGSVVYSRLANLRMGGPLQIEVLREALGQVVARHESLRTTLVTSNATPKLCVQSNAPMELPYTDLSDGDAPETRAREMAEEEARRSFDLEEGPLLRCRLLKIACDDYLLLLTFHHFNFDAWSESVLLHELTAIYETCAKGEAAAIDTPSIQYADFAAWDRSDDRVAALEMGRSYWRRELADPPVLTLPTDFLRPAIPSEEAGHVDIELPPSLVTALRALVRREGATMFTALLAAFQMLLYQYSGQQDIVVGCPVAGRNRLETEKLIGVFINTLPFRASLAVTDSFRQLLQRVLKSVIDGLKHQDVPLQLVVQDVLTDRDIGGSPLFQAMLIHERLDVQPRTSASVTFDLEDCGPPATMVDLSLELMESVTGVAGRFVYRRELWKEATIKRMVGHYLTLLEGIVADSGRKVGDLPVLSEPERHQLLVEWNDTAAKYPGDKCVHELFEQQVERTPDSVAVVFEDRALTYHELNERSNQLAHYLRSLGVGPETLVGLCLERSSELVVAILGILKAGGVYLPLDADYPMQRLKFMLRDSALKYLVTQRHLLSRLRVTTTHTVLLDPVELAFAALATGNPRCGVGPHNLAYTMYTSGSTGQPKGVQIPHSAVVNLLTAMAVPLKLTADDRLLSVTTPTFDISVLELLLPLTVGARVDVLSSKLVSNAVGLAARLSKSAATVMQATPATWQMLIQGGWDGRRHLKVLCGGEALPDSLAEELCRRCDALWNVYGPTETTIWSTALHVADGNVQGSIGRPLANTSVYVLDSQRQPIPIGVAGELYIGGAGLARGYLNRPELTAERFVANPFDDDPDSRLYRTGDLCRWRADGTIEFLGRLDNQVKLRGFRIELGEIDSVLNEHADVAQSIVTLREDRPGEKRLVAYLTVEDNQDIPVEQLRRYLSSKLPEYMLPAFYVRLDTLPLTPNGKVDRKALPEPDTSGTGRVGDGVAARTEIEEHLVTIWQELLHVDRIGIHDNFFELGGHSLLAVRLLNEVEDKFGVHLSLTTLFEAPTVSQLAEAMGHDTGPCTIVPLRAPQAEHTEPPLFCILGIFIYQELARRLDADRPVYAIHIDAENQLLGAGPSGNGRIQKMSVAELAGKYLEEIRVIQPTGPYHLAGICAGGLLAFEIAQQLRRLGQTTTTLAMFDTAVPGAVKWRFVGRLRHHLLGLARGGPRYLLRLLQRHLMRFKDVDEDGASARMAERRHRAMIKATRHYLVRPYPGPILLFRATDRDARPGTVIEPYLGWPRVQPSELHCCDVPSGHLEMLQPPHVQMLADQMRKFMRKPDSLVNTRMVK